MNTMTCKGYSARIEYDDQDEIFFGRIAGVVDVVGFHAETVSDLKAAFHEAVDDYLETCAKVGKEPQKPYSGKMMFRVSPTSIAGRRSLRSFPARASTNGPKRRLREPRRMTILLRRENARSPSN